MTFILNTTKNSWLLIFLFFFSCAPQSEFYTFYHGGVMDQDVDLMLRAEDSSYVYCNTTSPHTKLNSKYKEIGYWTTKGDTIVLTPKVEINDDSCSVYNPLETLYPATEVKDIPVRYYVKEENYLIDCTFDYYYPNDHCQISIWGNFPLYHRKIKQTKKEKRLIYSRIYFDRTW